MEDIFYPRHNGILPYHKEVGFLVTTEKLAYILWDLWETAAWDQD